MSSTLKPAMPAAPSSPPAKVKPGDPDIESTGATDTENGASTLIEVPEKQTPDGSHTLKRHDFPDGGGSGGAEAFRRQD